jgi:phosphohistidine phosphatase SixA
MRSSASTTVARYTWAQSTGFDRFLRMAATRRTLAAGLLAISGCVARGQPVTTVILVRHAEREALSTPDPELSLAGRSRARALVAVAREAGVQAIITTQYVRTAATAEPLAMALGLTPEIVPDTDVRHANEVAEVIFRKHAGQAVLVVGHGHTIPPIMRALGVTETLPRLCENQYDLIFVISVARPSPTRVVRARYGVPTAGTAPAHPSSWRCPAPANHGASNSGPLTS